MLQVWMIERTNKVYGIGGGVTLGYYTGETYQVKGEVYGVFIDWYRRTEAKPYTSKKRAENAMNALKKKVGNWDKLDVVPFMMRDKNE
jgi:hypothetical protein